MATKRMKSKVKSVLSKTGVEVNDIKKEFEEDSLALNRELVIALCDQIIFLQDKEKGIKCKTKSILSETGVEKPVIKEKAKLINCDQVASINAVLDYLLESIIPRYSSISRYRTVAKISAMLRLMEILNLEFADKEAAGNALAGLPEFNVLRGFSSSGGPLAGEPIIRNNDVGPIFGSSDPCDVRASHTKIKKRFRLLKKKSNNLKKKKKRDKK